MDTDIVESKEDVQKKRISIVVPVFNEAENIQAFFDHCESITHALKEFEWEYFFVNDGSADYSLAVLIRVAETCPYVKVIDLSRNFGKEIALSAGIAYARGDAVICIDADLQHPPELITKMVDLWKGGAEVVVAVRKSTEGKTIVRHLSAKAFHFFMNCFGEIETLPGNTDFRLLDRKVCNSLLLIQERQRLFRGLVDWLGYRRKIIEFEANARFRGRPTYRVSRLWELGIQSFLSHSQFPLRLVLYIGLFVTLFSALALCWVFFAFYIVSTQWHYTPLAKAVVFNTFLVGLLLVAMGSIGLYIAKIHSEVLKRPLFAVRSTFNCVEQKQKE
ncbi:glycosyltransferase family 2 protein [Pajaroellobacter abortibovis]|uniref:Glycosyltransferase 2-like domain-containing protein n=1 Tax=Pajaroellobacter abortibovis TaxID=1882918 RepID=A0A1L6MYW8_9BACT|nr:glycosyltransferase family 2 protein [Pajaroellobacter abortibovis]APS00764.1 hypothetical protein BCY86_08795 [Pajaroellobacter abortibovis]